MLVTLGTQGFIKNHPLVVSILSPQQGPLGVEGRLNLFLLGYPVETSAEERGFSPLGGRFQIKMNGCSLNDTGVVRSHTRMKFLLWYSN